MEISPLNGKVQASAIPFEQLAGNPNVSQKDKINEACRQFEAILLRQVIGETRKTVIHTPGEDDSNEKDIYNDMINNELADNISRSGSFGLAKSLESRLVRQADARGGDQTAPAATPTVKTQTH